MAMVPLFPLPMVAFPDEKVALHIFEPRYKEMMAWCRTEKRPFCLLGVHQNDLGRVGTLMRIEEVTREYEDGRLDLRCLGIARVEILRIIQKQSYYEADIIPFEDLREDDSDVEELLASVQPLYSELIAMAAREAGHEPPALPTNAFGFAQYIGFDIAKKQEVLELRSETLRLNEIKRHLEEVVPRIRIYDMVKNRITVNGDFRSFPSIDLNL
jgi:Lon protease-like protein